MAIIKKFRIKSFKKDQTLLELKNISKSFGERKILDNVSLKINRGEILGLLGPNGAGKTTTLRMMSTIIQPTAGQVEICGIDAIQYPRDARMKIGFLTHFPLVFAKKLVHIII